MPERTKGSIDPRCQRNLVCLLPDGHVPVEVWAPHPCGGWYVLDSWCYGLSGRVGRWMSDA